MLELGSPREAQRKYTMRRSWRLHLVAFLAAMSIVLTGYSPAWAQGRHRGPEGGPFRRPSPSGEQTSHRGPPGNASRPESARGDHRRPASTGGNESTGRSRNSRNSAERYAGFLKAMDANHDGNIDENEVDQRRRFFVERLVRRAGMEVEFPLSIAKLQEALVKNSNQGGSNGSSNGSSSGSAEKKSTKPAVERLVPGFAVEKEPVGVPKFGVRIANSSNGATSPPASKTASGKSSPPSSAGGGANQRIQRWAEAMIRQHDRNKNGKLEGDESKNMRGDFKTADADGDGVITREEMTARLVEYSRDRSRGKSPKPEAKKERSPSRPNPWADRRSYRFLSPTERLPEDLPPWFLTKDENADGQIAMAEYSTDWSSPSVAAANAAEFAQYDLNGDGMITPKECIAAANTEGEEGVAAKKKTTRTPRPRTPTNPRAKPSVKPSAKPKPSSERWTGW